MLENNGNNINRIVLATSLSLLANMRFRFSLSGSRDRSLTAMFGKLEQKRDSVVYDCKSQQMKLSIKYNHCFYD